MLKAPLKKTLQKHKAIDESGKTYKSEQQIAELEAQVEELRRKKEQLLSQLFTVERFQEMTLR